MTKNAEICNECLVEMFKRVGLEYPNEELTKQADWFRKYEWTADEEDDFKKWMTKLLKKKRCIRVEMEVAMFLLMWGWKTKEVV